MMRHLLRFGVVCLLLAGCATSTTKPTGGTSSGGFDRSGLDETVRPCDDFYQYANGNWFKQNPIPPERSSWGTFNILANENRRNMRAILDDAAKANAPAGSNMQKIGDLWSSCLDEAAVERAGLTPLQPHLARIDAIRTTDDLQRYFADAYVLGLPTPFSFFAEGDLKDPGKKIAWIFQDGMGLPEPNYYTEDDAQMKETREKYQQYVARMFELGGDDASTAAANARVVLDIETALARNGQTRVERRDPSAIYNMKTVAELQAIAPAIDWSAWLRGIGAPSMERLNVGQPKFMAGLSEQIRSVPIENWRKYLRFHLLNDVANILPKRFLEASFDFYGRTLEGRKEDIPRWERCVNRVDLNLGEALGQVYVERHFPPASRQRVLDMIDNLSAALRSNITALPWMTEATKTKALEKLGRYGRKIGHPEKWIDYSKLSLDRGSYFNNVLSARRFDVRRNLDKIEKPMDRTEWEMTPPTVNAYYNPLMNEIVFSAGILQPPFFNAAADEAYNYGAIGSVIGHELTHGFDDEGRKFAADGSLTDWWAEEDSKKFEAAAACVEQQFSSYDLGDGDLRMDGKLVLGESVADLAGLKIAYAAYQRSQEGKPREIVDGFTPEQRFFIGYAREWAEGYTPEAMRLQVKTDPHPVSRFRVNGPLANMPEFAAAFSCQPSTQMVRANRCIVW